MKLQEAQFGVVLKKVPMRLLVEVLVFVEQVPDQGGENHPVVARLGIGVGVCVAEVPSSQSEDGLAFVASF